MRNFSILLLITFTVLLGPSAFSAGLPILYKDGYACPTAHSEYKTALAEIKNIKSKLLELGCEDPVIQSELDSLMDLIGKDRQKFLNIISGSQGQSLSTADTQTVRDYSTKVTETVGGIISLLTPSSSRSGFWANLTGGKKACSMDETSRHQMVSKTASLVYEATNLVSKVAGPYGVPIAIGGNLLSGFLQGMSQHMKGNFDFSDPSKRLFFAETLCMYHQYDTEVRQLISPDGHLFALRELENFLVLKLEDLQEECLSCAELIDTYEPPAEGESFPEVVSKRSAIDKIKTLVDESRDDEQETVELLNSLVWVSSEIGRFQGIVDFPTQGLERGEIQALRLKLREYIELAGGEFLKWFTNSELPRKSSRLRKTLTKYKPKYTEGRWKDRDRGQHIPIIPHSPGVRNLAVYQLNLDLLEKSPRYFDATQWVYEDWKTLEIRLQNLDEYCKFFADAVIFSSKIEMRCEEKNAGLVFELKNYVAQTALHLAPFIKDSAFPRQLGPHEFSLDFYGAFVSGVESMASSSGYEEPFVRSFAMAFREPAPLFKSWEEQLQAEIKKWKLSRELRFRGEQQPPMSYGF